MTPEERQNARPADFSGATHQDQVVRLGDDLVFDFRAGTVTARDLVLHLKNIWRFEIELHEDHSDNWDHEHYYLCLADDQNCLVFTESFRIHNERPVNILDACRARDVLAGLVRLAGRKTYPGFPLASRWP